MAGEMGCSFAFFYSAEGEGHLQRKTPSRVPRSIKGRLRAGNSRTIKSGGTPTMKETVIRKTDRMTRFDQSDAMEEEGSAPEESNAE